MVLVFPPLPLCDGVEVWLHESPTTLTSGLSDGTSYWSQCQTFWCVYGEESSKEVRLRDPHTYPLCPFTCAGLVTQTLTDMVEFPYR
jgi:hypothetical protein